MRQKTVRLGTVWIFPTFVVVGTKRVLELGNACVYYFRVSMRQFIDSSVYFTIFLFYLLLLLQVWRSTQEEHFLRSLGTIGFSLFSLQSSSKSS